MRSEAEIREQFKQYKELRRHYVDIHDAERAIETSYKYEVLKWVLNEEE